MSKSSGKKFDLIDTILLGIAGALFLGLLLFSSEKKDPVASVTPPAEASTSETAEAPTPAAESAAIAAVAPTPATSTPAPAPAAPKPAPTSEPKTAVAAAPAAPKPAAPAKPAPAATPAPAAPAAPVAKVEPVLAPPAAKPAVESAPSRDQILAELSRMSAQRMELLGQLEDSRATTALRELTQATVALEALLKNAQ